jgi:hypothetical protein
LQKVKAYLNYLIIPSSCVIQRLVPIIRVPHFTYTSYNVLGSDICHYFPCPFSIPGQGNLKKIQKIIL